MMSKEINPFLPGASWNLTQQGELYKSDPERAERLQREAKKQSGEESCFSYQGFNLTAQGAYLREHGIEAAEREAAKFNTRPGIRPAAPKQDVKIIPYPIKRRQS